ncbi:MAG: hypothetical protein LBR15_03600 [Methanobrevibacter sp.]|nr:hypothetical protein [Candidatus Methanovirga australis]
MRFKLDFLSVLVYLPFIVFFALLVCFHSGVPYFGPDDYTFKTFLGQLMQLNWDNLMIYRYFHWSSRLLIDCLLPIFCNLPIQVWMFIDSCLICFMSALIPRLLVSDFKDFDLKNKTIFNCTSIFLVLIFYVCAYAYDINLAGYITTSLNYVWPFVFALLHFYLIKYYVINNNININSVISNSIINDSEGNLDSRVSFYGFWRKFALYFLIFFSLIFAISQEMVLCLILGAYLFIIPYYYYKKAKIPKIFFYSFILCVLMSVFVFLSPGNKERYFLTSIPNYLYTYQSSLLGKVYMGLAIFFNQLITKVDIVSYLFFAVFGIYIYSHVKSRFSVFSMVPFLVLNIVYFLGFIQFQPLVKVLNEVKTSTILTHSMIPVMIYLVLVVFVLFSLFLLFREGERFVSVSFLFSLVLVFLSQFLLGFFPVDFIHGSRWRIVYWGVLILLTAFMLYNLLEYSDEDSNSSTDF